MNIRLTGKIVGVLGVGVVGSLMSIIMPSVTENLIQAGLVSLPQAALVASIEMIGITVSLVLVAPFIASVNRRIFVLVAILLGTMGHCASTFANTFDQLLVTRSVAGLGEGAMIASMAGAIAASQIAERLFAIYITCNMVFSLIFFRSSVLIASHGGARAMYLILTILTASTLVALPAFPNSHAVTASDKSVAPPARPMQLIARPHVFLALGGTLTFFAGVGLVWPMMAEIGASSFHISATRIADALGLSVLLGALAGLGTSWLGMRAGRRIPISIGTIGVIVATAFMALNTSANVFRPAVGAFMVCWVVSTAFYMGCFAAFDRGGRLSALGVAMQSSGLFLGPAIASGLLYGGQYDRVLLLGATLCTVALAAMIAADVLFLRQQQT